MDVTLALLADYANVSQEGKLNVMGVFDRIWAKNFPAVHPEMRLVFKLEAGPAERGTDKVIEVKLLDADGKVLQHLKGQFTVPAESRRPTIEINQVLRFATVSFEKPGDYAFYILVGGDEKGKVPFSVEQLPAE
jgi:hypothetical protein